MSQRQLDVFRKVGNVSNVGSVKTSWKDAIEYAKKWKHELIDQIDINTVNWILKKDDINKEDIVALASIKKRSNRIAG